MRIVGVGPELRQQLLNWVGAHDPSELAVVGVLEARRPELTRGVADDRAHGRIGVGAVGLPVGVLLAACQNGSRAIQDATAHYVPRRCDNCRIVRRSRKLLSPIDLPVAGTGRQDDEG